MIVAEHTLASLVDLADHRFCLFRSAGASKVHRDAIFRVQCAGVILTQVGYKTVMRLAQVSLCLFVLSDPLKSPRKIAHCDRGVRVIGPERPSQPVQHVAEYDFRLLEPTERVNGVSVVVEPQDRGRMVGPEDLKGPFGEAPLDRGGVLEAAVFVPRVSCLSAKARGLPGLMM